jgi:hypothetical protein
MRLVSREKGRTQDPFWKPEVKEKSKTVKNKAPKEDLSDAFFID